MLAKRLPWWSGLEGLPFQVALHHRRLPGKFVQKIILAVTASIVFLTLIHGWGTPLDSLTSKATQIVLDHYKIPDNTQPYGENHAFVTNLEFLGIQTSNNSCSRRDLGFTGKLGDHWYAIHGDAIWCAPNQTNAMAKTNDTMFRGMVRNTISMMTDDVLKPYDLYVDDRKPVPGPRQFFEFVREWGEHLLTGFGGTSICAVDEKTGAVYYAIVCSIAQFKKTSLTQTE